VAGGRRAIFDARHWNCERVFRTAVEIANFVPVTMSRKLSLFLTGSRRDFEGSESCSTVDKGVNQPDYCERDMCASAIKAAPTVFSFKFRSDTAFPF